MDYNLPGSSVHGILQGRILEKVAIPSSRGSSRPRNQTRVSHIAGRFFTIWATRETQGLIIHIYGCKSCITWHIELYMSSKLYQYLYKMIKAKELFIEKKKHFGSWSDISYAWRSEKRELLWLLKSYQVTQKLLNAFGQTSVPLQQSRHRTKGEWDKMSNTMSFSLIWIASI